MKVLAILGIMISVFGVVHGTIVDLYEDTLATRIAKGAWLVEYYSPLCRHCKAFKPHYEQTDKDTMELQNSHAIHLARIDCDKAFGMRNPE